jgi:hypothetical protein
MALVASAAGAFMVIPYLRLDPALSRAPINPSFALHFPLLLVHIYASLVALIAGPAQFLGQLRAEIARTASSGACTSAACS